MKKSIRILNLPDDLIYDIEAKGVYYIHQLIKNVDNLEFKNQEFQLIRRSLNAFKELHFSQEIIGEEENDRYSFLNSSYTLDDLDLSLRSRNALNNHGITKVSKLFQAIDEMEIYDIKNMGTKSVIQVLEKCMEIVEKEKLYDIIPIYSEKELIDSVSVYNMGFSLSALHSLEKLNLLTLGKIRKAFLSGELSLMFNYKTLSVIINEIKKYYNYGPEPNFDFLKIYLRDKEYGYLKFSYLEEDMKNKKIMIDIEDVIKRLKKCRDIVVEEDRVRLPYFTEKLKLVKIKKESEAILLSRFSGNTLQVVAEEFKKTRERIRQIVRDRMLSISMIYEEAFLKEYNKYNWHPEVFKRLFGISDLSYNVIKYLGKNYPFEEAYEFNEDYVLELMAKGVVEKMDLEKFKESMPEVFPPRISIYGKFIDKLTKREFLEYIIEHHIPKSGLHKNKILPIANKVAKDNNLEYSYDKYIDIVTNTVQNLQRVRFYDYSKIGPDATKLFKEILHSVDSVYSCTYFYLLHQEELNKYNIHDGYELHFVLRRLFLDSEEFMDIIDFQRQPMLAKKGLTFSDVVISHWEKLKENVNIDDFADNLIERYGYHRGTLINIINANLGNYLSQKVLYHYEAVVDRKTIEKIKEILVDDFYELSEIENILNNHNIPKENYQYFSNSWLEELDYKTHDINYIIKKEFSSLKDVFHRKVLSSDIYQVTKKDHMMRETTLILFIENLRQEYLAFPMQGNKLITMKYLEKRGLALKDIKTYVNELGKYLPKETFFTHFSLKKQNYQNAHPIFKKFEDMNLDSELMASFIRNVAGVKKTTKGSLYRISKSSTMISEFIDFIKETENIEDYKELKKFIKNNYGFTIRSV